MSTEINTVIPGGFLGEFNVPAGNRQKFVVIPQLDFGVVVTGVTATCTSLMSTVEDAEPSEDQQSVIFFVEVNSEYEVFTVALNITLSDGQTWNFTVIYYVIAPVTAVSYPNPRPLLIGPTGPAGPTGPTGPTGP
jgi:hypothetical protein